MGQLVYFIRAGADGPVKIGLAEVPAARLRELQVAHHVALNLLGTAFGGERYETHLHERFAETRIRGEWFAATPALLALIDEHGFVDSEGPMPSMEPLVTEDPIADVCDRCGWPTQAELVDRGITSCYACLKEVPESTLSRIRKSPANVQPGRRLADSNCCKVPEPTGQPCGSDFPDGASADIVTPIGAA